MTNSQGGRAGRLGVVASEHLSRAAMRRVKAPFQTEQARVDERDRQALILAEDLVRTLGAMKGGAMKIGQVLSLLDLGLTSREASEDFARTLSVLYDTAPHVASSRMVAVMERELGAAMRLIAEVEPEPIAAASIGQVYRATLHDGRTVAIKVQYPDIGTAVRADLKNLALFAKLRARKYPSFELSALVDEVSIRVRRELDYAAELAHHRAVLGRFAGHPVFVIPELVEELCTERVLTTEFLDGPSLGAAGDLPATMRDHLGEAVYRFYSGGLYEFGEFCADPHPGNVVILPDGKVGFLDFGLYVRMDPQHSRLERGILRATLDGDDDLAYALVLQTGFLADPEAMPRQTVLEFIEVGVAWQAAPGPTTITRDVARALTRKMMLPSSPYYSAVRRQRLPDAYLFARRTELTTCALLATFEPTAPWRAIAMEWLAGAPPVTPMGHLVHQWRCDRERSAELD
ncbi:ABC1 kinase family protein [Tsukamurella tyrosinosolvens]|uniref:ABC1 kinase family protein n=1 Tax=Tsukamurella tyrosinosolvens TaxID=57704 RepID=UPI0036C61DFE